MTLREFSNKYPNIWRIEYDQGIDDIEILYYDKDESERGNSHIADSEFGKDIKALLGEN